MYLMIFEDGSYASCGKYTEEDLAAVDDGIMDIVDISKPLYPMYYLEGEWHRVKEHVQP